MKPSAVDRIIVSSYGFVTVSFIPLGLATLHRIGPARAAIADPFSPDKSAASHRAQMLVAYANWTTSGLLVAAGIATALRARSIALAARRAGVRPTPPVLAAAGWFIPFGWGWIPFVELRRYVNSVHEGRIPDRNITRWQVGWIVAGVYGLISRGLEASTPDEDLVIVLRGQGWLRLGDALVFGVVAVIAAHALRDLRRAFP